MDCFAADQGSFFNLRLLLDTCDGACTLRCRLPFPQAAHSWVPSPPPGRFTLLLTLHFGPPKFLTYKVGQVAPRLPFQPCPAPSARGGTCVTWHWAHGTTGQKDISISAAVWLTALFPGTFGSFLSSKRRITLHIGSSVMNGLVTFQDLGYQMGGVINLKANNFLA